MNITGFLLKAMRIKTTCKSRMDDAVQDLQAAVLNLNLAVHGATMQTIYVEAHSDRPKRRVKP